MATYTEFVLPPSRCERCGYSTFDGYCVGEIAFDDGDRVAVCRGCYADWESLAEPDADGERAVPAAAAAGFQRRGVENYGDRLNRELRERRKRRERRERRAAAAQGE